MNDSAQLLKIISDVLQPNDANLRKQSQNLLNTLRNDKPNELICAYMQILKGETPIQCRNFAASQLRLCLSNFAPASYTNLWEKLLPDVQQQIKISLFEIIYHQPDLNMKKHIADTIGEVAGTIIGANDTAWPEFRVNVWNLFKQSNINSIFAGFYILESFLTFAPDHFKEYTNDLYSLFKLGLENQNCKLKLSALKCFVSYLEVLEIKQQSAFQSLIITIFQAVYILIEKDSNQEGLQALSQMLEVEPRFFKKNFKELVELLTRIFRIPNIEGGVRRMTTEILVDYAEKSPALFRKRKEALESTIEMIFFHMVEISGQIEQEWKTPAQGYNEEMEDDEDFQTTRFGMGAVDRLIYVIGEEEMLPILSSTIQKLLVNSDWRYKYTAVMALSQIGEYIEDVEKISSILGLILTFLKNQNPMMRYAACHAIGQISDDMQPKFQQKYGNEVLPLLVSLLESDPVPRVVSHSAAALTNFLEGMKFEQVAGYLQKLTTLLLHHTVNGISLVQESALSAISSTVEIAKQKFEPYLNKTLEILFGFYSNQKYRAREYKQLKGQSIETITIIATSVGAEMFKPAAVTLIELMIKLQSSQFEQTDPQKTYILAGWQRLCLVYGKQLGGYLNNILPGLFTLVQNVIKEQIALVNGALEKEDKEDEQKEKNINTYETEQAEVAISMLNVFIEQLKELYNPYVEKTVSLLCSIIKEHPNEDVKEEACKCLPNLIIAVKTENSALAVMLAKHFMATLVETIQKEYDSDIVIVELETLKNVLEELGLCFLSEVQVKEFSQKMLNLLKNSDQKKQSTSTQMTTSDDLDEEEKEMIGEQIKQEEEVQVAISELIGALFKTHKEMTLGLASFLIENILPRVFTPDQSENMLKFGIFLIDDMVEFLGYDLLHTQWINFAKVLLQYTAEKSCVLRQAACYGLGIFAEKTPSSVLDVPTINLWLQALYEAVKVPKGSEKEKAYGHCRDNGVAAVGKIIKAHASVFDATPAITLWIHFLPLRHDRDEGFVQSELLVDIMRTQPQLILGANKIAGLQKVLSIYGEITCGNVKNKLYNDAVAQKIKEHIAELKGDPFFIQNLNTIWQSLSEKHRNNLTNFVK